MKYPATISQDDDDFILSFSDELLESTGWIEGDTILWTPLEDGSYSLELDSEAREWEYDGTGIRLYKGTNIPWNAPSKK